MRMKEPSKLDIGAKLFMLILWLLLSELVQCQNTFPNLPYKEEMGLQTLVRNLNLKIKFSTGNRSCFVGGFSSSCCIYSACNKTICHVEEVVLRSQGLEGAISKEVAEFAHLRILDLSINGLTGTIPSCLGKLSSLNSLDLSHNYLTGTIPACLGTVFSLHSLDLSYNYLTGSIPFGLGTTLSLFHLDLSYNRLSGSIPVNLGRNMNASVYCDHLGKVYLWFRLNLSYNKLYGQIPESLGDVRVQLPPNKTYNDIRRVGTVFLINLERNKLSGGIPDSFEKLNYYLKSLFLRENQLSGPLPPKLGNLMFIEHLVLDANNFTDKLPSNYGGLKSLKYFSLAGNHLFGPFPNFVVNWPSIQYLILEGNKFQGPIDPRIFKMNSLLSLNIADVENSALVLPNDMNLSNIIYLVLRNCSINGSIPERLGKNLPRLAYLDMSFNNLTGFIPNSLSSTHLVYMSFAKNMLIGGVPAWIGDKANSAIDLSFNNFSDVGSLKEANKQLDLNLFACCNTAKVPNASFCAKRKRKKNSLFINCGGKNVRVDGKDYEKDNSILPYYTSENGYWAYTSSGSFLTSNSNSSDRIKSAKCGISVENAPLYEQARLSPVYLKYYGFCLNQGNYNVTLNFAEIVYKDDEENVDKSSKKRMFDIYVQGKKIRTDFDIKAEAGTKKVVVLENITANVDETGVLEVDFYWAGRGSSISTPPDYFGPLVSAISVVRDIKPESHLATKIVSIAGGSTVLLIGLAFLVWRLYLLYKRNLLEIKIGEGKVVNLMDIKRATRGFSQRTKLGKGNLGIVFKATLKLKDNGQSTVAVKKLNKLSNEGLNQLKNDVYKSKIFYHKNIVQLFDVYIGREGLSFLVLEYMENKSLQDVLFDRKAKVKYNLDWNKRVKICKGIAEGLKYLHERQAVKMIHTGLKASNILLDGDFNAKLSDIGLGSLCAGNNTQEQFKLFVEEVKIGYAAPEYASLNVISFASDVYTFGVLVLEIVSGKRNSDGERFCTQGQQHEFLAEKVATVRDVLGLVDERLIRIDQTEARRILMLAKLCVDMDKEKRPTMSQIVSFLNNELTIDDVYKSVSPRQGGATTTETSKIATSDAHFNPTTIASGSTSPTCTS